MARANAYADTAVDDFLSTLPIVKRTVARMRPELATLRRAVARAFVIGFAAGAESRLTPRRAVRK